ncbi:MAG: T9SS type A sorting domain-containing protein [Bacteroidetes bacterium]|nr:T9SS type A sorting domain-containing protein [Bacteroidota bacterium]
MNQIPILPSLPNGLKNLECNWNIFTNLPPLPSSLKTLFCNTSRSLTTLPSLPNGLKELSCNGCSQLTMPTILPDSLEKLDCRNDSLTYLPTLPNNLKELRASNNQITCIPTLPSSLQYIDITNNSFTCLPNYVSVMDASYFNYPLCTPGNTLTNPNGCERADGIFGSPYFDTNANCLLDLNDTKLNNINFKLFDYNNQYLSQASSHMFGIYNFTYPTGNYTIVLDTANVPYTSQCANPGLDTTIQLTSINPTVENIDFSVKCKPGFDLGIQSVVTNGIVFPGQNHHLKIAAGDMSRWYNLNCASGISGQLTVNISGPVTYVAPAIDSFTPIVSGTTFTYNIADFGNVNFSSDFNIILKTDTTATAGDSICVSVNVTPISGDNNINNNMYHLCYGVVNSYDPNMKEVYPINVEPGYNDWFIYTIHFQNTGNATAYNIRLVDTLDANLDLETFKVINYSHSNTWTINNRTVFFNFQNIQLPDSSSNPDGSKGYVQYRIKPKNNLGAGTKIKNTAYIYFDYNSPIVTNSTINEYIQLVSVKEYLKNLHSTIYPNPNNGTFTIELSIKEKQDLQLFDMTGNLVLSQTIENGKGNIDANYLSAGVYNISIKGNNSVINKKVVIVK